LGSFHKSSRKVPSIKEKNTFSWCSSTNKISFNDQTVIHFAGLEKGQEITVPGEEISSAIKKLGKLGFDEISFYINRIQNDSIYLDLEIKELPKLNNVKFVELNKLML
jgi:outer membrane protein insertion porin family